MIRFCICACTLVLSGSLSTTAHAGIVDFNTYPNGTPFAGDFVEIQGDEWLLSDGVEFYFGDASNKQTLFNIREGGVGHAFSTNSGPDVLVPGDPSGGYFISSDTIITSPAPPLFHAVFTDTQAFIEGYILDVDALEGWQIRAYDTSDMLLNTTERYGTPSDPSLGDGESRYFGIGAADPIIKRIEIEYVGTTTVGFAIDGIEFSTQPIPEPGSMTLLGLIGMSCVGYRRRK